MPALREPMEQSRRTGYYGLTVMLAAQHDSPGPRPAQKVCWGTQWIGHLLCFGQLANVEVGPCGFRGKRLLVLAHRSAK